MVIIEGAGTSPGGQPGGSSGHVDAGAGAGAGAGTGTGAGAGAAGATAAGAETVLLAGPAQRMWAENKPKRGRPKGSKNTRPRVSKKPRSGRPVALGSQVASSSSSRCSARWSPEAKGYALAVYDRCAQNVAAAVRMCLREKPTVFGSRFRVGFRV